MTDLEYIHFKNKDDFHRWLQNNYDKSPGIWMVFYKKHTHLESVKYEDALDKALCFGWIDSIIKRMDNDTYARKFTPRTDTTKWSDVNKRKVIALIKSGRMNESGLKKIDIYLKTGKVDWSIGVPIIEKKKIAVDIPDFILKSFSQNETALMNFNKLSVACKRQYILWITSAKKSETIQKRINEAIGLLTENKKLGLK